MAKHEIIIGDLIHYDGDLSRWTCKVTRITRPRKVDGLPGKYKFINMTIVSGRLPWGIKTEEGFLIDFINGIRRGIFRNLTLEKRMEETTKTKMRLWRGMK